jgi:hypothetical protein
MHGGFGDLTGRDFSRPQCFTDNDDVVIRVSVPANGKITALSLYRGCSFFKLSTLRGVEGRSGHRHFSFFWRK